MSGNRGAYRATAVGAVRTVIHQTLGIMGVAGVLNPRLGIAETSGKLGDPGFPNVDHVQRTAAGP